MITFFLIASLQGMIAQQIFFRIFLWGILRLFFPQRLFAHDRC